MSGIAGKFYFDRRPKHGFTAPVGQWLRAELRTFVEDTLFSHSSAARELSNANGLRGLWQDHLAGRPNHEDELRLLLVLEVWRKIHAGAQGAARGRAL